MTKVEHPRTCPRCGAAVEMAVEDNEFIAKLKYTCGSIVMYSNRYDYYEVIEDCKKGS